MGVQGEPCTRWGARGDPGNEFGYGGPRYKVGIPLRELGVGHRALTRWVGVSGCPPVHGSARIGWVARGSPCPPGGDIGAPQAAEQGHRELCALLLRHRPALAALRDARGRTPRDGAHPAVWDVLDT